MFNLLAEESSGMGMILILIAVFVVYMVFSTRQQRKRQQETQNTLNAIQPGNKVKTIGGICGMVVEVCPDDNTIVLETGTEASGKSYIKFDKQAVYQTDAVAKKEEVPTEEPVAEETATEVEPPVEEVPVAEEVAEETVENNE